MALDFTQLAAALTAATTLITAIGGAVIAVKQSTLSKKVDENAQTRVQQIEDVKQTIVNKVDEIKRNGK